MDQNASDYVGRGPTRRRACRQRPSLLLRAVVAASIALLLLLFRLAEPYMTAASLKIDDGIISLIDGRP
jgi:hypothetical protein